MEDMPILVDLDGLKKDSDQSCDESDSSSDIKNEQISPQQRGFKFVVYDK